MSIQTINPATEELLETFEVYSREQVDQVLNEAREAFLSWRPLAFEERASYLLNVAKCLRARESELARIATLEMGKTIAEAESEVEKCAWNCEYFAENAQWFLADERVVSNATESYVAFRPLGVVLAIMPWNFPYWQVFRFVAPALMAGNTVVLKHASNVSRVALEIERIMQEAGLPRGVLKTVLIPGSEASRLIEDKRIAAVTLTGSEAAGVSVAAMSGQNLKKHVLELGGSDAFIILEDADLDEAAKVATTARFQNNGQSCIAAKRFIVVERIAEEFERKFVEIASKLRVGNPLDYKTQIGPLARGDLRDILDEQVQASVKMGARVLLGGKPLEGRGYFYAPTIVTGVTPDMPMFHEETFGPAAAIIHARDVDHAIELANDSRYGLSCNLWTRDIERARELAARIEVGGCFINSMSASDPRLPFGGIKHSGFGRELSSFGIREFVNIQTVWIGPKVENMPAQAANE
ncbi:MAG TPA: NAD-dependent succinate-semialdehyde dehydrogenase [Ktedonobacteraceae bacterium]|jgi:succinate-semialdehyde dehydrogenase/glutarate-semialdehyde dehydrogenase